MKHYILVHGAWEESRAWADVSAVLQQAGHTVTAIDLPGHGGNTRSLSEVTMAGYVQSLVDTISQLDHRVVLVGHSYAGMVVGGVAGRRGDRIKSLIYLDAHIPRDGMSMADMNPPERTQAFQEVAEAHNGWQIPPHTAEYYGVRGAALQAWIDGKCVPLPLKCLTSRTDQSAAPHPGIARQAHVLCTEPMMPIFQKSHEWARARGGWECREMATAHFLMITAPDAVGDLLLEYA